MIQPSFMRKPDIEACPGCPTLSWMIALRVTNPYEDSDAFISVTGRKGSGKTTASLALCEDIAMNDCKNPQQERKAGKIFQCRPCKIGYRNWCA